MLIFSFVRLLQLHIDLTRGGLTLRYIDWFLNSLLFPLFFTVKTLGGLRQICVCRNSYGNRRCTGRRGNVFPSPLPATRTTAPWVLLIWSLYEDMYDSPKCARKRVVMHADCIRVLYDWACWDLLQSVRFSENWHLLTPNLIPEMTHQSLQVSGSAQGCLLSTCWILYFTCGCVGFNVNCPVAFSSKQTYVSLAHL